VLQRERRQQWKADDHAECHNGERDHVAARRPRLLQREEEGRAEDRRDHGAQLCEEDGREICDGDARRR
jgi:hypothetical protein